ncbi:hypothetical protein ACQR1I_07850 [Bradyrhizobium sp. HKCCYLS2038]|uniref:hypothetical protein n=1 Tax=unclassified Bradyrhizobium TaxID=2631580 RepID=UPI003EB94D0C
MISAKAKQEYFWPDIWTGVILLRTLQQFRFARRMNLRLPQPRKCKNVSQLIIVAA